MQKQGITHEQQPAADCVAGELTLTDPSVAPDAPAASAWESINLALMSLEGDQLRLNIICGIRTLLV